MEFLNLNPKNFLKNAENFNKYQCGICYDITVDPVKCKGSCQQIYCLKCVSESKNICNKCPKRCSQPFRVVKLQEFDVQFQCPYSKQCLSSIKSLDSFNNHFQKCQFISPLQLCKKSSKKEYKCLLNHCLQFYTDKYCQMVSSICNQCKELKLCRSICRKCDEKYCIQCRIPPCSKKCCPIGHKFETFKNQNMQYICDVCGFNAWLFDDKIYDDKICNFGICKSCYDKLPQQIDNSCFSNLKNLQQKCECGSQLKINKQNLMKSCSLCDKQKKCAKYCQSCSRSYCLKCKLVGLFQNVCEFQHQYVRLQVQKSFDCMNCTSQNSIYFKDEICGLIICQTCKIGFAQITADKERARTIYCQKKHFLFYIRNYKTKNICGKCLCFKKTPLICIKCEEFYCLQCKTIEFKSCYFNHPLKIVQNTLNKQSRCDVCDIEKDELRECKKCQLSICEQCITKSIQAQKS